MDEEKRALCHKLQNAEQKKLGLKGLVKRAADTIEDLADADCSQTAIEHGRDEARRLRKAGDLIVGNRRSRPK